MDKIKIHDLCFYGDKSSSKYFKPKNIEWLRNSKNTKIQFFTDNCLSMVNIAKPSNAIKVAWLLEPKAISPGIYQWIQSNHSLFDYVFTHNVELIKKIDNGRYYPFGGSWVAEEDWKDHTKAKKTSMIASSKLITDGHRFRHWIINNLQDNFDLFGFGFNPVLHKVDALKDYCFSVAIENSQSDHYFTEKIIDCFATHTVPIYWGCLEIDKFFNIDGIILVKEPMELPEILNNLSFDMYNNMREAVKENFELAKTYRVAEDNIWHTLKHEKVL